MTDFQDIRQISNSIMDVVGKKCVRNYKRKVLMDNIGIQNSWREYHRVTHTILGQNTLENKSNFEIKRAKIAETFNEMRKRGQRCNAVWFCTRQRN